MAKNKKFYWLKLKEDFFDDDTIQFIEEQENGIVYSNFYLKLCLKSVRTEGKLMRLIGNRFFPYDIRSLAKLTGVPADTVAVAMKLFEQMGLVERLETGEIYLAQINEMIGTETEKAVLMRRKRAEEKLNGNDVTKIGNDVTKIGNDVTETGNNVPLMLPERYPEIEIEKRDREKREDIEIEEEVEEAPDFRPTTTAAPYEQIKALYNSICLSLSKCTAMSDQRKKAIKARLSSGYTLEDFKRLFEKAEASSFLKGRNDRNWRATFDWLICDANMAKTLDGNYDDQPIIIQPQVQQPQQPKTFRDMLREAEAME